MFIIFCPVCKQQIPDTPLCYTSEAPYYLLDLDPPLLDNNFSSRVELTNDQCVVDSEYFFIRGSIELKIIDSDETFCWSVWFSLSKESFYHMTSQWNNPDRVNDRPYFGWLMTPISIYPNTIHLKTMVQSREVELVPSIKLIEEEHPLAVEQQNGIKWERVAEFAHELLHDSYSVD